MDRKLSILVSAAVLATGVLATLSVSESVTAQASLKRPDLYVALAFDGSRSIPMWQETQSFASQLTNNGKPVKFTYFINTVYYLKKSARMNYEAPQGGPGRSAIGFGDDENDVMARYDQTNLAFKNKHEIANHAVGHFDGSKWNAEEWAEEFRQFYDLLFGMFKTNGTGPTRMFPSGFIFGKKDIIGFRAPQLGHSRGMFQVLPRFGIKYDTSLTASPNKWPNKNQQGVWNYPLALIPIAGTAKRTLSMDYNFYAVQSKAREMPEMSRQFEEQMYQSYMMYFQNNYNGNRAPLNIGHHFSKWNAGAYWRAMKRFANSVCGLPEVKCVTYLEMTNFMNKLSPAQIAAYEAGQFDKIRPIRVTSEESYDMNLHLAANENGGFMPMFIGGDVQKLMQSGELATVYYVNQTKVAELSLEKVRQLTKQGETATIKAVVLKRGQEIQSITHKVANVGTVNEQVSLQPEEASYLIADPPHAHDEDTFVNQEDGVRI